MFPKLHRAQIQRSILAVKQIDVPIKILHIDRIDRHSVLDHRLPMLPLLQLLYTVDETFPDIFLPDCNCENIQLICQQFPQFRNLQTSDVRLPNDTVIDIPHFSFRVVSGNWLKIICKSIADANLIFTIAWIGVWLHLFNGQRNP